MSALKKLKKAFAGDKKGSSKGTTQEVRQVSVKEEPTSSATGSGSFEPAEPSSQAGASLIPSTSNDKSDIETARSLQKEKYIAWGIAAMNGLANIAEATEVLAPLKAACGTASNILEIIQSMERNKEAWKSTIELLRSHFQAFNSQLAKMIDDDAAPVPDSLLLSPMKAYGRELEELLAAVLQEGGVAVDDVPSNFQNLRSILMRAGTTNLEKERIQKYSERLRTAMEKFNVAMYIYMGAEAQRVNQQLLRIESKLASGTEKSSRPTYGPIGSGGTQHTTCLEGTRTSILNDIDAWSKKEDLDHQVYCIGDVAGTGKSTIASHMTHKWEKENRLAARFFFSRGTVDTESAGDLCFAIAYELKDTHPKLRDHIKSIMKRKTVVGASDVAVQWQTLVTDPLALLEGDTFVLVIDALDECRRETRRSLLECILKTFCGPSSSLPHVRVFFTTRMEPDVRPLIENAPSVSLNHLRQSKTEREDSIADVAIYINHHLSLSAPIIKPEQRALLIDRSEGLFIFASTACALLKQCAQDDQNDLLGTILATNGFTNLDALYYEVLRRALPRDSLSKDPLRIVLGVILAAQQPLSMMAISSLLPPSSRPIPVRKIVLDLASVLASGLPDDPVYILHPTFREFLHQQKRSTAAYAISKHQGHSFLAVSCLKLLLQELKFDICGLLASDSPPPINEDIPDLTRKILRCTSSALRYAAVHWVAHGSFMMQNESVCRMMRELFQEKLFNWLEFVALLGATDAFVQAIRQLDSKITDYRKLDTTYLKESDQAWCLETLRFMAHYQPLLITSAMQVYVSTLVYWNRSSLIYEKYGPQYGDNVPSVPLGMPSVPPANVTLHGHTSYVFNVSFSPRGDFIASSSRDHTLKVWDTVTGAMVLSIDGDHGEFLFSPNGEEIISFWDKTIRQWDIKNGSLIGGPWKANFGRITSVCSSPDGAHILFGTSDGIIGYMTIRTGIVGYHSKIHDSTIMAVRYSPDGKTIATASRDKTICLWKAELTQQAPEKAHSFGQESPAIAVEFSTRTPLLLCSNEYLYRIYDITTRMEIFASPGLYRINCMTISPDGRYGVIDAEEDTIYVWDAETGASVGKSLRGHTSSINGVAFSPDSKMIVSCSSDTTVRTWAMTSLMEDDGVEQGHTQEVRALSISPDHRLLVSVAEDETLCIWDVLAGRLVVDPIELSDLDLKHIRFSPDGEVILCAASTHDIRLRSPATGEFLGKAFPKFNPEPSYITELTFSPNSQLVAMTAASAHRGVGWQIIIWRLGTPPKYKHACKAVFSIDFNPYKKRITFSSDSRYVCCNGQAWDLAVKPPMSIQGETLESTLSDKPSLPLLYYHRSLRSRIGGTIRSGTITQDEAEILDLSAGSYAGRIDIGNPPINSYALSRDFPVHTHSIDGGVAAFGSADGRVMLMDFTHLPAYQQAVEQLAGFRSTEVKKT
ncbi:hypothetical protein M408DRAFT_25193 [Serendipita vermifera MAFF 305830]|uniref:Nephrocystin 3-like N-terminal domain-containing protein n=1 Tax=Serendipita vermifera MAFF 305830 TaxID=933852 RepID=A0A0C2WK51_SERVB|nr:hypothetical protein M408DRAFT_25193 [Serendipita vermifera MAFF 305830]